MNTNYHSSHKSVFYVARRASIFTLSLFFCLFKAQIIHSTDIHVSENTKKLRKKSKKNHNNIHANKQGNNLTKELKVFLNNCKRINQVHSQAIKSYDTIQPNTLCEELNNIIMAQKKIMSECIPALVSKSNEIHTNLQSANELIGKKYRDEQIKRSNLENEVEELKNKLQKNDVKEQKIIEQTNKILQLNEQSKREQQLAKNENNRLKNELTKVQEQVNKLEDQRQEYNHVKTKFDQLKNEHEKDIKQHKKSKSELETHLNKLKTQLEKEKKKYNRVEKYSPLLEKIKQQKLINIQNQKLSDLEKARSEIEDRLRKEAKRKEDLLHEKDNLHFQLTNMQNEINQLKKHQQEQTNNQDQNGQLLQEQKEFKDTANQIAHLEKEKDEVENRFTTVSNELANKQQEMNDQQNNIKSLRSKITELENEQAILLAEKDKTIEQLHAKVKSLEQLPQYNDNKDIDTELSTLDHFKEDAQGQNKNDYSEERLTIQQNEAKKINNHLDTIEKLKKDIEALEEQIENMSMGNHDQVEEDNGKLISALADTIRDGDADISQSGQGNIEVNNHHLEEENVDATKKYKTYENGGVRVLTALTILGVAGGAIKHIQDKKRKVKKNNTAATQVPNNMDNI